MIFDGAAVGSYATVRDSIVGKGAVIAGGAVLNGVVIGDGATSAGQRAPQGPAAVAGDPP